MGRPCYPAYTAGPCMKPWQVAALAALTAALTALWLPVAALTRAAGSL